MSRIIDAIPNLLDKDAWVFHSNPGRAQRVIDSSSAVLITANLYLDRNEIAVHIREKELKANRVFVIKEPYPPQKVLIALMTGIGKKLHDVAKIRIDEFELQ